MTPSFLHQVEAKCISLNEMRSQQILFEQQMAKVVMEAGDIKAAYAKLAGDYAEQEKAAVQVCLLFTVAEHTVTIHVSSYPILTRLIWSETVHLLYETHYNDMHAFVFLKIQARLRSILSDMLPTHVVRGCGMGGVGRVTCCCRLC